MEEETKKIVFCQGDKKELEEITGEEYEFIKPEEIKAAFPESKPTEYSRNINSTFISIYVRDTNERKLLREFYKEIIPLNADAVIHYSETFEKREGGTRYGFAIGTLLRKRILF